MRTPALRAKLGLSPAYACTNVQSVGKAQRRSMLVICEVVRLLIRTATAAVEPRAAVPMTSWTGGSGSWALATEAWKDGARRTTARPRVARARDTIFSILSPRLNSGDA